MSCLLCCCGSKPTDETGAAGADVDRQEAAEFEERVRGESDSASALVDAEPRESDLVSIAKSEAVAATELRGSRQIAASPTEHHSSFINTEGHQDCDLIPPNLHQECDIVLKAAAAPNLCASSASSSDDEEEDKENEFGDLSNNNNRYRNRNRTDSSSRPKSIEEKEMELGEAIFKEINLRRSEMNKPAFKLCDHLNFSARIMLLDVYEDPQRLEGRFFKYKLVAGGRIFTNGCFVFKIDSKNVILSELPRFVVNQWCPRSMVEASPSQTEADEIGPMLQNNRDLFGDPMDSAMSLMMNSKYQRVGVIAGLRRPSYCQTVTDIVGIVLFDYFQVGWYTIFTMQKCYLRKTAKGDICEYKLVRWTKSTVEHCLSEAISSLARHAEKAEDSTVREPRTMARPLLAESTRRIKEAEQLKACANLIPGRVDRRVAPVLIYLATHLETLGNQLLELAGAADRNELSQRQILQRLEEAIDETKDKRRSARTFL